MWFDPLRYESRHEGRVLHDARLGLLNGTNRWGSACSGWYPRHVGASLAGLLADDDRRAVFAAIVLGAQTPAAIIVATGLSERAVTKSLDRLMNAGLVQRDDAGLLLDVQRIQAEARQPRTKEPGLPLDGYSSDEATVISNYLVDGRLTQYPTQQKKQRVVLNVLSQSFEPGKVYSEAQVNLKLGMFHADSALLRRSLVDHQFLERRDGMYWRSGGTFELPEDLRLDFTR
jgi:hypothetical protein